MLWSVKELSRCEVTVRDGSLGPVRELYFDDAEWTVRYLIVRTSRLFGRDVLIAPAAVERVDADEHRIDLALDLEQVKQSPPVDFDRPVSRQLAEQYFSYFSWPYWAAPGAWGLGIPMAMPPDPSPAEAAGAAEGQPEGDRHLRSFGEVTGYHIAGINGRVGHLEDLLVDDESWGVRYLVVDTRNWWFGKQVLLLPGSVRTIDWGKRLVHVDLTRERIKAAPQWQPGEPLRREDEFRLHAHYAMNPYWTNPRQSAISEQPGASPEHP